MIGKDPVTKKMQRGVIPLFKQLEEMDVPVTLISSRAVPASIAPPPPLIDLAEVFTDLNEDARFYLTDD